MTDKKWIEVAEIASAHPSIHKIGLFGSYARGDQSAESDIDIVYDYDETMTLDMMDCLSEIQEKYDKKIDFFAYYLLFEKDGDAFDKQFKKNVANETVWIYEKQ